MTSKVCVLIPTFRPNSYIDDCFKALDTQTLDKSEYVVYVALNGEKDPYFEYVKGLLEQYAFKCRFFYLKKAGVSNARNYLIDHSEEPLVCFLDDDDILSSNYLESLLGAADDCSLAVSNVKCFKDNLCQAEANYIGKYYTKLDVEEASTFKARKYFSSPCAKMISRKIIGDARFDPSLNRGEDALFMAHISPMIKRIRKAMPEACYYVRERSGSATRKKVKAEDEFKRVCYLMKCYGKMLVSFDFKMLFIGSRMLATLMQLKKLFR